MAFYSHNYFIDCFLCHNINLLKRAIWYQALYFLSTAISHHQYTMSTRSGILLVSLVVVVVCMSQGLVEATDFKCSEFKDAFRQHKELL